MSSVSFRSLLNYVVPFPVLSCCLYLCVFASFMHFAHFIRNVGSSVMHLEPTGLVTMFFSLYFTVYIASPPNGYTGALKAARTHSIPSPATPLRVLGDCCVFSQTSIVQDEVAYCPFF